MLHSGRTLAEQWGWADQSSIQKFNTLLPCFQHDSFEYFLVIQMFYEILSFNSVNNL